MRTKRVAPLLPLVKVAIPALAKYVSPFAFLVASRAGTGREIKETRDLAANARKDFETVKETTTKMGYTQFKLSVLTKEISSSRLMTRQRRVRIGNRARITLTLILRTMTTWPSPRMQRPTRP